MKMIKRLLDKWLNKRRTGLIPQRVDARDYLYVVSGSTRERVDLRSKFPRVVNQGNYNSCTAHTVAALMNYYLGYKKEFVRWSDFNFSVCYQWYLSRARLGKERENYGAILRDCFKVVTQDGFVTTRQWDFHNGPYTVPSDLAFTAASFYKLYLKQLPKYMALNSNEGVKNALSNDALVAFAFPVTKGLDDGLVVGNVTGYHAMLVVGYNDTGFIVRNSWGRMWGDDGYVVIPFDVFEKYSFDKWTLM